MEHDYPGVIFRMISKYVRYDIISIFGSSCIPVGVLFSFDTESL